MLYGFRSFKFTFWVCVKTCSALNSANKLEKEKTVLILASCFLAVLDIRTVILGLKANLFNSRSFSRFVTTIIPKKPLFRFQHRGGTVYRNTFVQQPIV